MLGNPKYKCGDIVRFLFPEMEEKEGSIEIVDAYGTLSDNSDASYDIFIRSENTLYKHISERFVTEKVREARPEERL